MTGEGPVGERFLIVVEVARVPDRGVPTERHIEPTAPIEAAQPVVSGSIEIVEEGCRLRGVFLTGTRQRIEAVADEADLEDVYNTERHLLYVACTRARDHLLVSGVKPVSEFLGDLSG